MTRNAECGWVKECWVWLEKGVLCVAKSAGCGNECLVCLGVLGVVNSAECG